MSTASNTGNRFGDIINNARTRQPEETEQTEVEEQPATPPATVTKTAATKKAQGTKRSGKSSNPDYRHVSAYLKRNTHQAAHKKLLEEGNERDLSDVMEALLNKWLKGKVSI